jgi:hypothetical protein
MAIPPTPVPAYPNVPPAPGVPPLVRQAGAIQSTVVALVSDGAAIASLFLGPQWGLFTAAGAPVFAGPTATPLLNNLAAGIGLSGQSVLDVEYSQDQPISSAPQQPGAFVSYTKVQRPFTARISYAVSGLQVFRTAFVQQAQALIASLDLIALIMPEFTFASCNVVHWDFRRQERKPSLLVADFWIEQVRVVGTAAFSNTATASPSGADPQNGGTVQSMPDTNPNSVAGPAS